VRSQLWNADVFLLLQIVGYIQRKDWDRARTALRLYTYETRKAMTRFTNASNDSVSSKPHAHCVSPTLPPALPRLSFRSECDLHTQEHVISSQKEELALDPAKTMLMVLACLFPSPALCNPRGLYGNGSQQIQAFERTPVLAVTRQRDPLHIVGWVSG
jgi:hypothetical protein